MFSQLERFVIRNAKLKGKIIGKGSYGTVEEVEADGILYAGKIIHEELVDPENVGVTKLVESYEHECCILSELRHPHIVQFMGICYSSNSHIPVLVMEYLPDSLERLLNVHEDLPLFTKMSILEDVTKGLVYLHSRTPEPVVHRDLTSVNVLLNSANMAKIADFGVSRIIGDRENLKLTRVPGNLYYMPPEAFETVPVYSTKLDMFSFGNLSLYTLTQEFPQVLPPSQNCHTEMDRRRNSIQQLHDRIFTSESEGHPLTEMVKSCLNNDPEKRPTACEVLDCLKRASVTADNPMAPYTNQLELIQELRCKHEEMSVLTAKIQKLEAIQPPMEPINQYANSKAFRGRTMTDVPYEEDPPKQDSPASPRRMTFAFGYRSPKKKQFHWEALKSAPCDITSTDAVVLDGEIYVSGKLRPSCDTVLVLNPENGGSWNELPKCPNNAGFAMAVVNQQLVLVGGHLQNGPCSKRLTVWDKGEKKWKHPYTADMPTARRNAAAAGYGSWLAVAGGDLAISQPTSTVEVFDSIQSIWFTAKSLPTRWFEMTSTVLNGKWYLLGGTTKRFGVKSGYSVSLPELITLAVNESDKDIWRMLPDAKHRYSTSVAFQGSLLAIGGRDQSDLTSNSYSKSVYEHNFTTTRWEHIGALQYETSECVCVATPNGKLVVIGGCTKNGEISRKAYIGQYS